MRDFDKPGRSPAHGMTAMAATSHTLATAAAIDILRRGGNAMDAAITACAVQCVVEPGSTGVGGDNFCLYAPAQHDGAECPIIAFNGSGRAPAGATCEVFADLGFGDEIPRQSPHSVTVPGAVDAWCRLNADHGRLPLTDLLAPAIAYARDGYPVSSRVSRDWASAVDLMKGDETLAETFLPEGRAPKPGAVHRQPLLAATLQAVAEGGRDAFYTGEIARDMVACLNGLGGLHTMEDFATASGEYVAPISAGFRDQTVWQCPPNGQGVIALLLLNIMAGVELGDDPLSAQRIHAEIEACRLAYRARNIYVADPAFAEVDIETLLSPGYADRLRAQIDPRRARSPFPDKDLVRHGSTVTIAVVDGEGNACSFINTLFDGWGAGICAPKSGVIFTNRGQGFSLDPASPNRIAPGKRPLHTIIPAMVTKQCSSATGRGSGRKPARHDGTQCQTTMAYGVMGGEYQAMGHMQFLTRIFDYGMDIQEAMDAPRFMADPWTGDVEVENSVPETVRRELAALGHHIVAPAKPIGGSQAIWIDRKTGALTGGSDPRKDGCAIGF